MRPIQIIKIYKPLLENNRTKKPNNKNKSKMRFKNINPRKKLLNIIMKSRLKNLLKKLIEVKLRGIQILKPYSSLKMEE
jgi:hypothetical protein